MVSSNTPPASSAPSPTSLTFQARDGSRSSRGFRLTTCLAICTKMGLLERPLWEWKKFWWTYTLTDIKLRENLHEKNSRKKNLQKKQPQRHTTPAILQKKADPWTHRLWLNLVVVLTLWRSVSLWSAGHMFCPGSLFCQWSALEAECWPWVTEGPGAPLGWWRSYLNYSVKWTPGWREGRGIKIGGGWMRHHRKDYYNYLS